MAAKVLIIDDSELIVQMLTMVCQGEGFEVQSCSVFADVASTLARHKPDVIITDLNLPDVPGTDPIAALRAMAHGADCPILIISGQPQATLDTLAVERGAQGALSKDGGLPAIAANLPRLVRTLAASRA